MASKRIDDKTEKLDVTIEEGATSLNSVLPLSANEKKKPKPTSVKSRLKKPKRRLYFPSRHYRLRMQPINEDPEVCNKEDMQFLLRLLKDKDEDNFTKFVWKFPHLLYCGDTIPLIEHEGSQYNILQIAVLLNSPQFCQLIIDLLEQPHFCKRLFLCKRSEECSAKMVHLIRLYLNSDSGQSGDTPLHYASKYGLLDCCKILLSHQLCDTKVKNKEGLMAYEVMCINAKDNKLNEDLELLFKDGLIYVPVFRSCVGLQPVIGKPCEAKFFDSIERNPGIRSKIQTEWDVYFLKAFAGPMPLKVADKFYSALKGLSISCFTIDELSKLARIKQLEPGRGIERIGRCLAKDMGIEWKEFFPGLDVFTNLANKEELEVFERYWKKRRQYAQHCGDLPSLRESPVKICLTLLCRYQPHINPLCHRANNLYCYYQKFMQVKIKDMVGNVTRIPPAFSSGLEYKRFKESVTLGADDPDIFMNSYCLSNLDKEIYVALPNLNTGFYPETHRWKILMTSVLQAELLKRPVLLSGNELNPLKPIPVPKMRDIAGDSPEDKENA